MPRVLVAGLEDGDVVVVMATITPAGAWTSTTGNMKPGQRRGEFHDVSPTGFQILRPSFSGDGSPVELETQSLEFGLRQAGRAGG